MSKERPRLIIFSLGLPNGYRENSLLILDSLFSWQESEPDFRIRMSCAPAAARRALLREGFYLGKKADRDANIFNGNKKHMGLLGYGSGSCVPQRPDKVK